MLCYHSNVHMVDVTITTYMWWMLP